MWFLNLTWQMCSLSYQKPGLTPSSHGGSSELLGHIISVPDQLSPSIIRGEWPKRWHQAQIAAYVLSLQSLLYIPTLSSFLFSISSIETFLWNSMSCFLFPLCLIEASCTPTPWIIDGIRPSDSYLPNHWLQRAEWCNSYEVNLQKAALWVDTAKEGLKSSREDEEKTASRVFLFVMTELNGVWHL